MDFQVIKLWLRLIILNLPNLSEYVPLGYFCWVSSHCRVGERALSPPLLLPFFLD